MATYPYLAKAIVKYKSPHKQDLTFAKGETIRVLSAAPKSPEDETPDDDDDDEEDWLVGESLDSIRKGTFPSGMVEILPAQEQQTVKETLPEAPPVITVAASESGDQTAFGGAPLPVRPPVDEEEDNEAASAVEGDSLLAAGEDEIAATSVTKEAPPTGLQTLEGAADAPKAATAEGAVPLLPSSSELKSPAQLIPSPVSSKSTPSLSEPVSGTPARSPPPPAAKPAGMSLRDRIAAFNKPAEEGSASPPPVPRSKPGGWKRPAPTPGDKPVIPGAPPAVAAAKPSFTPRAATLDSAEKSADPPTPEARASVPAVGGFSAADAQTSIKMSLKERMAALQRGDGGASTVDAARSVSPPAPAPGKLAAERRNVALASIGVAEDSQASSDAIPDQEKLSQGLPTSSELPPASKDILTQEQSSVPLEPDLQDIPAQESTETTATEETSDAQELTEEEQEQQRRAAIAKRMAALGGRRVGGGPLFGGGPAAPPPVPAKKASIDSAVETVSPDAGGPESVSSTVQDSVSPPSRQMTADSAEVTSPAQPAPPQTLAVPRRAAPPRRKKSASPVPPVENSASENAVDASVLPESVTLPDETPAEVDASVQSDVPDSIRDAQTTSVAENIVHSADDEVAKDATAEVDPATTIEQLAQSDPSATSASNEDAEGETASDAEPVSPQETDGDILQQFSSASVNRAQEEERENEEANENPVDLASSIVRPPSTQLPAKPLNTSLPPRPPSTSSQIEAQAPARTPSAASIGRPPIPRSTLPPPPRTGSTDPAEVPSRRASVLLQHAREATSSPGPAPPRRQLPTPGPADRPPIPTSPPPLSTSPVAEGRAMEGSDLIGDRRLSFAAASAAAEASTTSPALAAPRPRHAVPADDEQFEDDEPIQQVANDDDVLHVDAPASAHQNAAHNEVAEEPVTEQPVTEEQPPAALTEEEEEAERRARIAKRMAALGGQRMGGMPGMPFGAPMPPRRQASEVTAEVEKSSHADSAGTAQESSLETPSIPPRRGPPSGGIAIPGIGPPPNASQEISEDEAAQASTLGGPPDRPPVSDRRPSRQQSSSDLTLEKVPDESTAPPPLPPGRRSAQVSSAGDDELPRTDDSLSRLNSTRPPVPVGIRSRNPSTFDEPVEEDDDEGPSAGTATILSSPTYNAPLSPPAAPLSPPPRAPSRVVQPPVISQPPPAIAPDHEAPQRQPEQEVPSSTLSLMNRSGSPRDLDLQTGTRWWRAGTNPLRLPPTLTARPDAILYVDQATATKKGRTTQTAVVHVLFEDYSQTIIDLAFDADAADEAATAIAQRHNAPPPKPSTQQLVGWSNSIGSEISKIAASATSGKASSTYGDGSSRSFVSSLVASVRSALQPVGRSFGAQLLSQTGPDVEDRGTDEHRPGDIVVCYGLDLRGKKGLASYHTVIGHAQDPAYGVVIEVESKKNKLKCVLVPSASAGKKSGAPEEVSIRIDDAKAGTIKVYRVAPADGWIEEW